MDISHASIYSMKSVNQSDEFSLCNRHNLTLAVIIECSPLNSRGTGRAPVQIANLLIVSHI